MADVDTDPFEERESRTGDTMDESIPLNPGGQVGNHHVNMNKRHHSE